MSVTVTGNLKDLTTIAVTTNCFVRFNLRGCNGAQARVSGTALIPPQGGTNWYQDFVPSASGVISGTIYSNDVDIDTTLTPSGHGTWYGIVVYNNGIPGPETPYNLADGTTFNLNSATPITTIPVVATPTGDTTYPRLDGGNMPFTGQVVGKNGAVGSPSFAFASSLTTGFWRQAADVIGVSIAGALKWLINAAGLLFGSGGAIGFSSNSDPSAAGGDIFLNRQSANKAGLGTTASAKDGILLLSKLAAGGTEAAGSAAGDLTASRTSTSGALFLGTDGAQLLRSGDSIQISGTTKTHTFPNNTGTIAELNLAQAFTASQTIGQTTIDGTSGKVTTYNNIATVGNGVPSEPAVIDLATQAANIGTTTAYAVPASGGGLYRIQVYAPLTQAASVSSTMVSVVLGWTDKNNNTAVTFTMASSSPTANAISATNTTVYGSFLLNIKASTNITYQTTSYASSGGTVMQYALAISIEKL